MAVFSGTPPLAPPDLAASSPLRVRASNVLRSRGASGNSRSKARPWDSNRSPAPQCGRLSAADGRGIASRGNRSLFQPRRRSTGPSGPGFPGSFGLRQRGLLGISFRGIFVGWTSPTAIWRRAWCTSMQWIPADDEILSTFATQGPVESAADEDNHALDVPLGWEKLSWMRQ